MNGSSQIAVIGAGIAGLSCATMLTSANLHVSVFDKSHGPAGRMSSRRGDGWQCDHGAQYFTARDPVFRSEVARWERAGVAALWTPRLQVIDKHSNEVRDSTVERFVGSPYMSSPADFLAETLRLCTSTTIRQLQRHEGGWRLESLERGWLDETFDAVVVALPAPQAAPLLLQDAPNLAAVAHSVTMRGCWALLLRYPEPVDLPFDAAFVNDDPLRWVARDNSKPGRYTQETWLLHANAEWSEANLETSIDAVADLLIEAFGELGAPTPASWMAHRWRYADTECALDAVSVWDRGTGLGICGDWLNGGKVEGAWLSGRAMARLVSMSL